MASSDSPDAAATMADDRGAQGAGALLGSEKDVDDDVLSNLLSASWPTPAVVDENMGGTLNPPWGGLQSNSALTLSTAVE